MTGHQLPRYPYLPPGTYPLVRYAWRVRLDCRHYRTCRAASYLAAGDTHGLARLARSEVRGFPTFAAARRWALALTVAEARCHHCHRPRSRREAQIEAVPWGSVAVEHDDLHYLLHLARQVAPAAEWIERTYDRRGAVAGWAGWIGSRHDRRLVVVGCGAYPLRGDWERMP